MTKEINCAYLYSRLLPIMILILCMVGGRHGMGLRNCAERRGMEGERMEGERRGGDARGRRTGCR